MKNIFGPNRQSIRLREYDYTSTGAYFVTMCTQGRLMLFGDTQDGKIRLSPVGKMVHAAWKYIPQYNSRISLDDFIVMPDHFHGIILMGDYERGNYGGWERNCGRGRCCGQGRCPAPTTISLSSVIGRFKSWTTHAYQTGIQRDGWPALGRRLWQRNYYERVIRNEKKLARVREYIRMNPLNWASDTYNPPL